MKKERLVLKQFFYNPPPKKKIINKIHKEITKMKTTIKTLPLFISLALLSTAPSVWAAGTAANTDINNTATINYSVGGTSQTEIESSEAGNSNPGNGNGSATTFKVDKKIDLLVTAGANVNVVPATSAQPAPFTLKNEGNSTESFSLTPTQVAGDSFDTTSCTTEVTAVAPGAAAAGVSLPATGNITLKADQTATLTVKCDIPTGKVNGNTSVIDLRAAAIDPVTTVTYVETAGGDNKDAVDVVLTDTDSAAANASTTDGGDRNAAHSAVNTYVINTADLKVKKTSAVTKMSINGVDDNTDPKRIPGSTIVYSIVVTNDVDDGIADAAAATGIVLTDTVPSELTISSASIVVAGAASASITPVGQLVTSAAFDLNAGETATLTITTTVN